jgi:rubrerythrin
MPLVSLRVEEIETILSWGFGNGDFKPDKEDLDKKLLNKLKKALYKEGADDIWEQWVEPELTEEEIEEQKMLKEEINKMKEENGIFYCSKCKVRTNQKTPTTRCVICDTSLMRMG